MPKKKVGAGRREGTRDGCRARAIASWPAHGGGFGSSGSLEAHDRESRCRGHVYRLARLARPRELRRAQPARAPEHREPTPPSDSEFP